jgi:hypothetical protein
MPQNLLNPFQRVFAMSLGIHSEVDCDSNDQFVSYLLIAKLQSLEFRIAVYAASGGELTDNDGLLR